MIKQFIKNGLITSITTKPFNQIYARLFGAGLPIYVIHRITENDDVHNKISARHLRQCLALLRKRGYHLMSLEDAILHMRDKATIPEKSIVFTMDDGFADQTEIAAPIFLEYDCPVTIFLITGMLDGELWPWDDQVSYLIDSSTQNHLQLNLAGEHLSFEINTQAEKQMAKKQIRDLIKTMATEEMSVTLRQLEKATAINIPYTPPPNYRPMTWDDARQFEQKGVHFAPHTVSHRILSKLDKTSVENEIRHSWQRISTELKRPSPIFCYPTGRYFDYGPREISIIKEMGMIGAVSTIPSTVQLDNKTEDYLYHLPRYTLNNSIEDLKHDISWLGQFRNRSILFSH